MKTVFVIFLLFLLIKPCPAQTPFWQQTNGPYGGDAIAILIDSSQRILVGTSLGGVFRSRSGSQEWEQLTGMGVEYPHLVTSLLSKSNGFFFAGTTRGLLRSTDDGQTWINVGLNYLVNALAIDSSGCVYAGLWKAGVFRTTNNGDTWSRLGFELATIDIKVLAANTEYVFAAGENGMYRIGVAETSWTFLNPGFLALTISARANGVLLAGTNQGVFSSSNNGGQWNPFGLAGVSINGIATASDVIIATSYYSGVFRSTDNGTTWSNLGFGNSYPRSVVLTPQGTILVGTYKHGLFESAGGTGWTQIGPPSIDAFRLARGLHGDVWVGSDGGRVFRSTNNGRAWVLVADSLTQLHNYVQALLITSDSTIFVGGRSFWPVRSTNGGTSWTQIHSGLTNGAVEVLTTDLAGNILAGTQGGLFRSLNQGESWQPLGLSGEFIYSVLVTPDGTIIVGTSWHGIFRSVNNGSTWAPIYPETALSLTLSEDGFLFAGGPGGVFRSANTGSSWVSVGLQGSYVQDVETDRDGHVFAVAPSNGVFRSTNNGDSWELVNSGLTDIYCNDLTFGQNGFAVVGTRTSGVFRSVEPTTSVVPDFTPQLFSVSQNYPNPFNPSTTINFQIPTSGLVTLRVFDLLGKEVATILSERLGPGNYRRTFNSDRISSGVYFYRLNTATYSTTRKMLLLH